MVREGEIKIGDRLADNDPRMPNRVVTVKALWPKVFVEDIIGRRFAISPSRVFADGKTRHYGFNIIREAP
jgi:hypothetical protein